MNLSGQAVGISLAGAGTGLRHTSFAVPINQALAVARGIQAAIRAESLAARNIHAKMKRSRQAGMPRNYRRTIVARGTVRREVQRDDGQEARATAGDSGAGPARVRG